MSSQYYHSYYSNCMFLEEKIYMWTQQTNCEILLQIIPVIQWNMGHEFAENHKDQAP
jgi:hypothetical protein